MKIRETVFASESERELFVALQSRWGNHWSKGFTLYPQLPFSSIIHVEESDLSEKERRYLHTTSVDYTLCTKKNEPLVSVEFDGMSHGFSRDGRYISAPFSNDSLRTLKLNLKAKVCKEAGYPFFVVSYDEKVPLGEDLTLTIVDGIIGRALAHREVQPTLARALKEDKERIAKLSPSEQQEYFQGLVIDVETATDLDWNPIAVESAKLQSQAQDKGLWGSWSTEFLSDPELPDVPPGDLSETHVLEAVRRRVEAARNAIRVGCRITVQTPKGEVTETFWMRNLEGFGVTPVSLAEDIVTIILAKRLLSQFGGSGSSEGVK